MVKSSQNSRNILRVAVMVPLYRLFDYKVAEDFEVDGLIPGIRLRVPFGSSSKIGVLLEVGSDSDWALDKLKVVQEVLDTKPLLSADDLDFLAWVSRYYHYPMGEVVGYALPVLLRQGRQVKLKQDQSFRLTDLGTDVNSMVLARAPRQQGLLRFMKQEGRPIAESALRTWHEDGKKFMTELMAKGYVELCDSSAMLAKRPEVGLNADHVALTTEQQQAVDRVNESLDAYRAFLLDGITGSGKTEVYMRVIDAVISQGKQVLVLLPEISLTPQIESRFRQRFSIAIAVSHSSLTDSQRCQSWLSVQHGHAGVLLGTRSALFNSIPRLGLIIVDEEHDVSFKQQERLRFSARDMALLKAKKRNIPIILGSATPSLESLSNVLNGRYQKLTLTQRIGTAVLPTVRLLDIRNQRLVDGLSEPLMDAVRKTVARGEQVILFLNRRGFSPALMCHGCGWVARCPRCDVNLVLHEKLGLLRCHHCDYQHRKSQRCEACRCAELVSLGIGTERVERALVEVFGQDQVVRIDRDSIRHRNDLEVALAAIHSGQAKVILGTQMLSKGHHFENVTLVGIIDIDSGLFSVDYHAPERLAQLIVQVSGRAGRSHKKGLVLLQTRQPDHLLLRTLIEKGFAAFAKESLLERKAARLPPFSFQALFRVSAVSESLAMVFLQQVQSFLGPHVTEGACVLGPVPAPIVRRAERFHYQLLLQANQRKQLHQMLDLLVKEVGAIKMVRKVRWSIDVDPVDLY
ncbi:MAG: primosomal protein N' [Methylococcales bacterium]|nr:primosomal protein N' [Methylococcales bacterium]